METGAKRHPRIQRDGDRAFLLRVGPRRPDEEPADMDRRDRRLPCLEPVLVVDRADRELTDRSEAERLQVAKRVAGIGDLRDGIHILDEIRLHGVIGAPTRRDRNLHRDAVVPVATQDLADRLDRLRVGGNGDLEPADTRARRASCRPSRL